MLTAVQDLPWMSQGETVAAVAGGVLLYAHGSEAPKGKPNQERGIALHAQGNLSARAHAHRAGVVVKLAVTVASTSATVDMTAVKHLLATAAGAYLKIDGRNIELGAPGSIDRVQSSKKRVDGSFECHSRSRAFPLSRKLRDFSEQFDLDELVLMDEALSNVGYVMRSAGGSVTGGKLDPDGMTARIYSKDQVDVELLVGDGDWGVVEDVGVEDLWAEENNEGIT